MNRAIRTLLLGTLLSPLLSLAATPEPIRVGALAFGTLNWELAAMEQEKLTQKNGIALKVDALAGPEAGKIGIQGGSLDVIVADWIWVAQQRLQGQDLTFVPFSALHGALVVPQNSPIQSLQDLKGKRLGVAGGGQDKNWILLKTAAQKSQGIDLEHTTTVTFGAPPLLSESLKQGQLDAVLTYWNQATKLEAQGYREILNGQGIQQLLGIEGNLPTLGYVFHAGWAQSHPAEIEGFLKATAAARKAICTSDPLWNQIATATQETDESLRAQLRKAYCSRPVPPMEAKDIEAMTRIYEWVSPEGTSSRPLPAEVFWRH